MEDGADEMNSSRWRSNSATKKEKKVVDPLALRWNFLTRVETKVRCAEHGVIIPARNRHYGGLEEKLSVAVVQQKSDLNDSTTFLETELADFNTMAGTSNMAEQINDG